MSNRKVGHPSFSALETNENVKYFDKKEKKKTPLKVHAQTLTFLFTSWLKEPQKKKSQCANLRLNFLG